MRGIFCFYSVEIGVKANVVIVKAHDQVIDSITFTKDSYNFPAKAIAFIAGAEYSAIDLFVLNVKAIDCITISYLFRKKPPAPALKTGDFELMLNGFWNGQFT
ncbi:MAG: hypothetical protein ABI675_14465 [Chitinophagaceae bacterium]